MGNTRKRRVVEDFIATGDLPPAPLTDAEAALEDAPDEPLDAAWLADVLERRRRLHENPIYELPRYRDFFKDPTLTEEQADRLLEAIEIALARPEDFHDALVQEESIFGTAKDVLSCAYKIPRYFPTRERTIEQEDQLNKLAAAYPVTDGVFINPNEHHFEMCDPGWWHLLKEKVEEKMQRWPRGLAPFRWHVGTHTDFVYRKPATAKVALFADFGVGQYHSTCIAKQLANKAYPYIFHLGDVYYGGTQQEFDNRFTNLLEPVMAKSQLWALPENHELYGGGVAYQTFIDHQRDVAKRMEQEGSYFCVRFPKHQFIAIDVNWLGRQRFRDDTCREWLNSQLEVAAKDKLTTILLTGSAPFTYGERKTSLLYDDLLGWSEQGHFPLWFWGDDHYCALFERRDPANFVGSCIGHAGFPGNVRRGDEKSFVKPVWVETEARFPPGYNDLRYDLTNNGWCELEMLDTGGVKLTYVDWLGAKRFTAHYEWAKNSLIPGLEVVESKDHGREVLF